MTTAARTYADDLSEIKRLIDQYGGSGVANIVAHIGLRQRPYAPSWVPEPADDQEIIDLMRCWNDQQSRRKDTMSDKAPVEGTSGGEAV